MRVQMTRLGLMAALLGIAGCQRSKTHEPTAQDIDAAKQDAAKELDRARREASKDIKNATKIAGPNSREVTLAKATASYDVAMVKADGEHKIATEKCLTLQAPMVQPCKDQADAAYEAAKEAAKKNRLAREQ